LKPGRSAFKSQRVAERIGGVAAALVFLRRQIGCITEPARPRLGTVTIRGPAIGAACASFLGGRL
jgi:hypothetical protein